MKNIISFCFCLSKRITVSFYLQPQTVPVAAATTAAAPEKLTIRQLNQIFTQTDATGRLP